MIGEIVECEDVASDGGIDKRCVVVSFHRECQRVPGSGDVDVAKDRGEVNGGADSVFIDVNVSDGRVDCWLIVDGINREADGVVGKQRSGAGRVGGADDDSCCSVLVGEVVSMRVESLDG